MSGVKVKAWFLLFRPWSYTATLVPFLLAAAAAVDYHDASWAHWAVGLVVGLLFQATVNLLNTWGDERSGVDDAPGAIRTTPQVHDGLISMRAVLTVALACAFLAGMLGVALCFCRHGCTVKFNWPLLAAGFIGFLGATNYSTGFRFKYRGLGVPFVSFLMGPLETFVALVLIAPDALHATMHRLGTDLASYVLLMGLFILWTLPVAALVGVIMHGNDMRDIPSDRAAGIVTLASRLGPKGALIYYAICHALPYVVCGVAAAFCCCGLESPLPPLLPFLCLPLTVKTVRTAVRVYRENPANPKWRGLERASGGIHFLFGLLYAGALAWCVLGA